MKTSAWLLSLSLAALGAAVMPLSGCSSNKNHEEREAARNLVDPRPTQKPDQVTACIGTCLPDPGSRPINCTKQEGEGDFVYEWAWGTVDLGTNFALATYTYDDNTPVVLLPERPGWQPVPETIQMCDQTRAVRFRGGPFTEYGGGFGTSFITAAMGNDRTRMELPASPEFPLGPGTPPMDPPGEFSPSIDIGGAYDLRDWDGIAIWVRRGPNGQSTLRVGLTERNSAEDLNTSYYDAEGVLRFAEREGKYCKRYRLCGCAPDTPCTPEKDTPETTTNRDICWDPAQGAVAPLQDEHFHEIVRPQCGIKRCDETNQSVGSGLPPARGSGMLHNTDALFYGRDCNVAYTSDGLTNSFCYNPGQDPNPPAKRERCGNPFSRPITVGLDWQLIRVPFTELRQADDAFVADEMDLSSVKQLVMTHTTGWIDFWVANIGFYRKPPTPAP